jgi:methionyl aminopeptidase
MSLTAEPVVLPKSNDSCWCGSGRKYKRCHKMYEGKVAPGNVSPMRPIPDHIAKTNYYATGEPIEWDEPRVKSPEILAQMRITGKLAAEILAAGGEMVRPGITTDEIDAAVHQMCIDAGAYPSTWNYRGYPKSLCTSINEVICHGIPDDRALVDGDIVNLDFTAWMGGVHGDTNATYFVGDVDAPSKQLVRVTRECMWKGINAVVAGRPISDIGRAIEDHARRHKYSVVKAFIGHGIGEQFHTDIPILHYFDRKSNMIMRPGMTFTIEPMIAMGRGDHLIWDDDWTATTVDGKRTAQFEHTILVTETGYDVLTIGQPGTPNGPLADWTC